MVGEGTWVNDLGSCTVAEKNLLSNFLSVSTLAVDGRLAVPLYLFEGFHRPATSGTIDDSKIDWTSFSKKARLQLWWRKDATPVTNEKMISVSQVLNEAL